MGFKTNGIVGTCLALSAILAVSPAHGTTVFMENFSSPSKLSNNGATAELGNGGTYPYGTWIYANANMGINDPAEGDGSGSSNGNSISSLGLGRPQDERGTNARALSIILNGNLFAGGVEYTVSFDVIGDASGNNTGRYWLALVSGTDADDGIAIDGTQNGWGAGAGTPKPFTVSGSGNAVINYVQDSGSNGVLIDGEDSAGTTPVSFTFTHDGVSDVAFAVGTYNNIFAIDNVQIDDPNAGNILPEVTVAGAFGKYIEIGEGGTNALEISASDADGSVTNIRVFIDDTLIDENASASSYTLSNAFASVAPGAHELEVIATDNQGGVGLYTESFYIVPVDGELTGQYPYTAGLNMIQEYLRFLPENYNSDTNRYWPMILWLHGAGRRGSDANNLITAGGPPNRINQNDPLLDDFIVLSPQCKAGEWWSGNAEQNNIDTLLDEHISRFRVDTNRIIITGQSMGGAGTYTSVIRHPDKYAAAVPICGNGDTGKAASIAHLPIWIFHGDADNTVPYQYSVDMYNALTNAGAQNTKFHTITNGPHNVWTETYQRADLYHWMLMMSWLPQYYPSEPAWEPLFTLDTDGDGMTSEEEYEAGTSPTNPLSVFRAFPPEQIGSDIGVSWSSVPGRFYTVHSSTNPGGGWSPLQPERIPGNPSGTNSWIDTSSHPAAFYRIEVARN
jgi:predicted esterase